MARRAKALLDKNESATGSAKRYTHLVTTDQPTLFDRRKYNGVLPQAYQIKPPRAEHTVLQTLPAYYAYLQSGQYSWYTPDDFASDVKRFGLFVKDKPVQRIQAVDFQQWLGTLKQTIPAARLALWDENKKLKSEQVIFFAPLIV